MNERTLVFIKPAHVDLADKIFGELDQHGTRINKVVVESVPRDVIEAHYKPQEEKDFFGVMVNYFTGKTVVLAVYEGKNVVETISGAVGPTDPSKAPKNTIRGKFGDDSVDKANAERRALENVVHRSDSSKEAEREIKIWKKYL